jgi:hypothetical protein
MIDKDNRWETTESINLTLVFYITNNLNILLFLEEGVIQIVYCYCIFIHNLTMFLHS